MNTLELLQNAKAIFFLRPLFAFDFNLFIRKLIWNSLKEVLSLNLSSNYRSLEWIYNQSSDVVLFKISTGADA